MDELSYNTPLYEKDKEYTECELCDGDGWLWLNSDELHKAECKECLGSGVIEIEN
jgi:DnaJ-class molecular chaperone